MKGAAFWVSDFVASLWLPLLFVAVAGYLLSRVYRQGDKKHSQDVMGIALGVVLGFVSQIMVGSFDEFRKEQQFKRAAVRLLQQDAEAVYRTMWLFDGLLKIKSPATDGMDRAIPPQVDMPYWSELKKDHNFLLLARDQRFAEIFYDFRQLEEVNQMLDEGRSNQQAARMGHAIFHEMLRKGVHRRLLLKFIDEQEIAGLDEKYKKRAAAGK